jgi:ABC-type bacteriocin/lantibiotic exporter with double-glycine peptidase domain
MRPDPRPVPGIRESFRRLGRAATLLRPYWSSYAALIGVGIVLGAGGLVGPLLTMVLIDGVYPTGDVTLLQLVVGAVVVHSIFTTVTASLRGYYGQVVGARLKADTSVFLVNHLHHLPLRFFERYPVGDLLSRFGDLRSALRSVKELLDLVFLRGVYLVLIPPVLFFMNWRLALVAFATLPITTAISAAVARALRKRWKVVAEANAELSAINVETLSHARLFKGMGLEHEVFRRTTEAAICAREEGIAAARLGILLGMATGFTRILGQAILTYFGWILVIGGTLTLGAFLAFVAYLAMVQGPLSQVTSLVSRFQRTAVTLDRVFEILDQRTEMDPQRLYDPGYSLPEVEVSGGIRIEDLQFGYPGSEFSLSIPELSFPEGSVTALVGESGSGKSTLLRLLAALEEPLEGTIWYGAWSHARLPLDLRRRSVSMASQDSELLRGSLRANIQIGLQDVRESEMERVIKACALGPLVRSLPEGLDTPVAEWGATLSGGQRQRISIARALIRPARLILLDEVTSNLDADTEKTLMEGIMAYCAGRTLVITSHRASTVRYADRVLETEPMPSGMSGFRTVSDRIPVRGRFRAIHEREPTPVNGARK